MPLRNTPSSWNAQPSVYNYIKEVYPDVFAEIKKRVDDGSWQLVGPMWVESDLNLSGGETLPGIKHSKQYHAAGDCKQNRGDVFKV